MHKWALIEREPLSGWTAERTILIGDAAHPMLPYMGLLHTSLGNELADFMQGKESANQALSDVEAAYTAAAKEKGYL